MNLIGFNQILGLLVLDETGKFLGRVFDLVLDYQTGKFLALVLDGQKIVKVEKVKNFGQDQITVSNQAEETLAQGKIQQMIKSKIKIKGNRVITESGTKLGRIADFKIDLISNKLAFIFVRTKILGKPLRIPQDQIISIGKRAIIIKDQLVKISEPELVGI